MFHRKREIEEEKILSSLQAIQQILTTGCISLRCGMVPGTCKFGGDLPFLCGILGLSTTWMVPSLFSGGIWSDVHQEFIGMESREHLRRTHNAEANCLLYRLEEESNMNPCLTLIDHHFSLVFYTS